MAKFKKLAMLCTALMMTASMAAVAGCGKKPNRTDSSSPDNVSSSVDASSSEDEASSSEDEASSSEDEVSSSEDEVSSSEDEVSSSEDEVSSPEDTTSSDEPSSDGDSSSEDDSSSDEPVETPDPYYESIVSGEAGSITTEGNYASAFGTVTFNAPSAGTYAIYAVDAAFEESLIKFGPQGATDGWNEFFTRYTFDVAAAGEVTLATYYTSWDAETLAFNYYVYKLNPVEAETAGSVELATCVRNEITFNIPEAGDYIIKSAESVDWFSNRTLPNADFTGLAYSFTATEAGEYTVYVESPNYSYEKFNFDYELIKVEDINLVAGENTVSLYAGVNMNYSFTPATTGTYTLEIVSDYSVLWDNMETTVIVTAEAGQTVSGTIRYSGYDADWNDGPFVVDATINVGTLEEDDPSNLEVGDNIFTATADGVNASFTAPEKGWYSFSDGYTSTMWFADTVDSADSYKEVQLAAGETVSFTVKYDGIVTITIEKFTPPVELNVGENTVSVGASAELNWNVDYYTPYTMTISDANVVVYINEVPYVQGEQFQVTYYDSYSIGTLDGSEAENVVITVTKFEYPALVLGDNADLAVSASGTTYQYTVEALDPGCYTFTITGDVTNVTLGADDAINYPESLSAAGAISIDVFAGAVIELYMEAAADTTVSVNVACTSTVNSLETSVVMNEDQTAPVSLTIPSLKYGECAYYVATRMTGDYMVSWNAETYDGLIVYAGENVGISYNPQVRLTRTMMDGNVYLIVVNNCTDADWNGVDLENVVLNFAIYEAPSADVQGQSVKVNEETTIEIASWGEALFHFVAPATGTYTLKTESSIMVDLWIFNEQFSSYDRAWANVIDSETGGEYTFELAEGEFVNFWAMEYNMNAVSFVFTISDNNAGGETPDDSSSEEIPDDSSSEDSSSEDSSSSEETPQTVTVPFTADMPTTVEIPANGTTIMEGYIVGEYKVEWDPSITNLVVYYGMQPVANGDIIKATSPMMPTQLTLSTSDGAYLATRVMVSAYVAPAVELVLDSDNAIDVVDTWQGTSVSFTATEDGTYILSAAEGETNAVVMIADDYGSETIALPYSFTLAAGEAKSFVVLTGNYEADTINLVVTKEIKLPTTPEEIVNAAYELASGESLDGTYTLTGVITKLGTYNASYGDINVTFTVEGLEDKPMYCYALKGTTEGQLSVGDTITVSGTIKNYKGTVEFDKPQLVDHIAGDSSEDSSSEIPSDSSEDSSSSEDEPTIVTTIPEALAAEDGTGVVITGTVASIDTAWSDTFNNISVTIADEDGNTLYLYRLTTKVGIGDVITVTGTMATYKESRQVGQGATAEIITAHTCSSYTEATCSEPASCVICGLAKDDVLADHDYVDGICSVCGAPEGVETITASKTIAELIVSEGWTNSTTKQEFALDDVVTVKVDGGNNTGKAYDGDHIRIYSTDTPAGSLTISLADGYELISIKVSTKTGTYAFLCLGDNTEDISNVSVVATGSSVVLNSVQNGDDGKQVRVTAIEVVYAATGSSEIPGDSSEDSSSEIPSDSSEDSSSEDSSSSEDEPTTPTTPEEIVNAAYELASGESLEGTYTLTGVIISVDEVYSTQFSNVTVTIKVDGADENKTIQCYRMKGTDADLIGKADTITVTGTLTNYNGTIEFATGCTLDSYVLHVCSEYTEATCTTPATCIACDEAKDDVLADHNFVDGICSVCSAPEGVEMSTVTVSIADYATANSWANDTQYSTLTMNEDITVTATGGSNTGKYYTSGTNWRLYQTESPSLTITAVDGKTIVSVKITYVSNKTGCLTFNDANVVSDEVVAVNANSITFGVGNTGTATNGQVRITAIEVVYAAEATEPAEPTADEITLTVTSENATDKTMDNIELLANTYGVGTLTLTSGEYTFLWLNASADITVTVNGTAITSGTKIKYDTETVVEVVITPVDMTTGVTVDFGITESEQIVNEWTDNY